jgi:hypothetical protein
MTTTPPMTNERRLASYASGGKAHLTPAQHRRLGHKVRHGYAQRQKGKATIVSPAAPVSVEQVITTSETHQMSAAAILGSIDTPRQARVSWVAKATQATSGRLSRIPVKRRKGQAVKSSGEAPLIARDRASKERKV